MRTFPGACEDGACFQQNTKNTLRITWLELGLGFSPSAIYKHKTHDICRKESKGRYTAFVEGFMGLKLIVRSAWRFAHCTEMRRNRIDQSL